MSEQTDIQHLEEEVKQLGEKLGDKITALSVLVQSIISSIVSRQEIMAEDAKRVSVDRYEAEKKASDARIDKLENAPARFIAWAGLLMSALTLLYYLFLAHAH